jgi:hypothetical protein
MPDYSLKGFRVSGDGLFVHNGDDNAGVSYLGCEAAIAPHYTTDFCTYFFCVLESSHEIGADILRNIAPTHRKHEHSVLLG